MVRACRTTSSEPTTITSRLIPPRRRSCRAYPAGWRLPPGPPHSTPPHSPGCLGAASIQHNRCSDWIEPCVKLGWPLFSTCNADSGSNAQSGAAGKLVATRVSPTIRLCARPVCCSRSSMSSACCCRATNTHPSSGLSSREGWIWLTATINSCGGWPRLTKSAKYGSWPARKACGVWQPGSWIPHLKVWRDHLDHIQVAAFLLQVVQV